MFGNFNENFAIVAADTDKLRRESYQLRYKVFCLEKELFKETTDMQYLTEYEMDEYDQFSLHNLLLYKPTQKFVGTVRLIYAKLAPAQELPIEKVAGTEFYTNRIDYINLPRTHLAEISRLAVLPCFRPNFAVLGLLRAIAQRCHQHDIQYIYAAMEPRMQRILERLGIQFHTISPLVDYHGMRQCFIGFLKEMANQTYYKHPGVWEVLTDNGRLYPKPDIPTTYIQADDQNDQLYNYY